MINTNLAYDNSPDKAAECARHALEALARIVGAVDAARRSVKPRCYTTSATALVRAEVETLLQCGLVGSALLVLNAWTKNDSSYKHAALHEAGVTWGATCVWVDDGHLAVQKYEVGK